MRETNSTQSSLCPIPLPPDSFLLSGLSLAGIGVSRSLPGLETSPLLCRIPEGHLLPVKALCLADTFSPESAPSRAGNGLPFPETATSWGVTEAG